MSVRKKALITGHKGFLGRHFHNHLSEQDYEVVGIDTALSSVEGVLGHLPDEHFDLVIHAAAALPDRMSIDKHPKIAIRNTRLDSTIFDWLINQDETTKFLYISSCAVYPVFPIYESNVEEDATTGEPYDTYGAVKRHGELMARSCQREGREVSIIRPFSGYGTDQASWFPFGAFLRRTLDQEDPFEIFGSGTQVRDFVHVDDIVAASMAILESETPLPVNIGTGVETSMITLAETFINIYNELTGVSYRPVIQLIDKHPGAPRRVANIQRLRRDYTPTISLENGVRRAIAESLDSQDV